MFVVTKRFMVNVLLSQAFIFNYYWKNSFTIRQKTAR